MLGSIKPVIYTSMLHITTLILLIFSIPAFTAPESETLIFWFLVVIVFFTYFSAS